MKDFLYLLIGLLCLTVACIMHERQKERDKEDIVKRLADELKNQQNERE